LIIILPHCDAFADVPNRDVLWREQAVIVKCQDKEWNLSRPHPRQVISHLIFILLVGTTRLEFEDCMLWDRISAVASGDVVDREGGPRFVTIVSAWTGRLILAFFAQLLLEVTIGLESHEAFETGKLIRDDALM
jgi:hypothetical protein